MTTGVRSYIYTIHCYILAFHILLFDVAQCFKDKHFYSACVGVHVFLLQLQPFSSKCLKGKQ